MIKAHKIDRQLSSVISRIGHRDEGFSMISAIMALMVGTLLSLAAWATANSDIKFTDNDKWGRLAYQRAQSGVSDYVQHMAENSGYWKTCDRSDGVTGDGLGQTAINDKDIGAADHPIRRWLPYATQGSATDMSFNTQYSIELQPLTGTCKPIVSSSDRMIDNETGTFRVSVTGRAGPNVPATETGLAIEAWRQKYWKRVTIIAEFRRNGFLDYGYFTDHEGQDPKLQSSVAGCNGFFQDQAGAPTAPTSEPPYPGRWRFTGCTEISFSDGDKLAGPFHTNDSVQLSSTPSGTSGTLFGKDDKMDRIETFDNGKSVARCPYRTGDVTLSGTNNGLAPNCIAAPRLARGAQSITGAAARYLDLPEDNEDLITYADPASGDPDNQGYSFYGATKIVINANNTLTITTGTPAATTTRNFPSSGVIYVFNNGETACQSDPYNAKYVDSITVGCAVAEVQGTYNKSLTIGSESDIVITGDIKRGTSPSATLGLIAQQYMRVRHYSVGGDENWYNPARNSSGNVIGCSSDGVSGTRVSEINAAVLTLNNSFTVDGYNCGDVQGFLTVNGALAQRWRGTVGQGVTVNGSGACVASSSGNGHGYCKSYNYDYTFKSQTPPHFLAPTAATWKIIRLRQTLPACACESTR